MHTHGSLHHRDGRCTLELDEHRQPGVPAVLDALSAMPADADVIVALDDASTVLAVLCSALCDCGRLDAAIGWSPDIDGRLHRRCRACAPGATITTSEVATDLGVDVCVASIEQSSLAHSARDLDTAMSEVAARHVAGLVAAHLWDPDARTAAATIINIHSGGIRGLYRAVAELDDVALDCRRDELADLYRQLCPRARRAVAATPNLDRIADDRGSRSGT